MTEMPFLVAGALWLGAAPIQDQPMSLFITSVGPGNGADLGGLDGLYYCFAVR